MFFFVFFFCLFCYNIFIDIVISISNISLNSLSSLFFQLPWQPHTVVIVTVIAYGKESPCARRCYPTRNCGVFCSCRLPMHRQGAWTGPRRRGQSSRWRYCAGVCVRTSACCRGEGAATGTPRCWPWRRWDL